MVDKNLQKRAGLNVGTEPLGWVIDKAMQNKYIATQGSEVPILQPSPDNNRLVVGKKAQGYYIYGFSNGAAQVEFQGKWYNEFDESIDLIPIPNAVLPAVNGFTLIGFSKFGIDSGDYSGWQTLAPNEKLTVKMLDGNATFFVPTMDIKRKPRPGGGGGGLSDGNVVTVRATITSQGVEVGPPPGKAWAGLLVPGFGVRFSTKIGHFGALSDSPADVEEYLIDVDGNEYFIEKVSNNPFGIFPQVDPQMFKGCGGSLFCIGGGFLAYPNKWKLKLVPFERNPLPQGRIQLLATFQEFDLPKDAQ